MYIDIMCSGNDTVVYYDYTWYIYTTVSLRLHMTSIYNSIITTTHDIYIQQYITTTHDIYIQQDIMCSGNDTVVYICPV
jgi:hypothetical protein